jgi:hypothetical protein
LLSVRKDGKLSYGKRGFLLEHHGAICICMGDAQKLQKGLHGTCTYAITCFSWHQHDDGKDDGAKEQRLQEDKTYGAFAVISILPITAKHFSTPTKAPSLESHLNCVFSSDCHDIILTYSILLTGRCWLDQMFSSCSPSAKFLLSSSSDCSPSAKFLLSSSSDLVTTISHHTLATLAKDALTAPALYRALNLQFWPVLELQNLHLMKYCNSEVKCVPSR